MASLSSDCVSFHPSTLHPPWFVSFHPPKLYLFIHPKSTFHPPKEHISSPQIRHFSSPIRIFQLQKNIKKWKVKVNLSVCNKNAQWSQTNVTNVTMPLLKKAIWGHIWKRTVVKSWTNAINVTMHLPGQTFWGHIWKRTMKKSQTNATDVILHPLMQVIWGYI